MTTASSAQRASVRPAGRVRDAPMRLLDAARQRARRRLRCTPKPITPFAVEGLAEALGFTRTRVPPRRSRAAVVGGLGAYLHAVVLGDDRLPDRRRRPAVAQLADVHSGDLRDDGARRGARRARGAFRSAAACRACTIRCSPRADFELASRNRFFLCLRSDDPAFDAGDRGALPRRAWRRSSASRCRA